jgi:methionine-rich copper-binding protein CopC
MSPGMKSAILTVCALVASLPASAHSHLLRSTPADGSVVLLSPPRLLLEFSAAARLTALSIQKNGDAARRKLAPLPTATQSSFAINLPGLAAGGYLVRWRALSDDNHVSSGSFGFTLRAK